MLSSCNLLESELTVPGLETISTRAEMKEHLILDNLAISDLQIITASGRSGPKFKPIGLSCLMRLMLSRRKSLPNLKTALWAHTETLALIFSLPLTFSFFSRHLAFTAEVV